MSFLANTSCFHNCVRLLLCCCLLRELDERDYPYRQHGSSSYTGDPSAGGPAGNNNNNSSSSSSQYSHRGLGYSESLHQPGRDAYDGNVRAQIRYTMTDRIYGRCTIFTCMTRTLMTHVSLLFHSFSHDTQTFSQLSPQVAGRHDSWRDQRWLRTKRRDHLVSEQRSRGCSRLRWQWKRPVDGAVVSVVGTAGRCWG